MAREADHLAGTVGKDKAGGMLSRLVADENEFDRRALWRLGTWATAAVGAVIVAMLANQSSIGLRRQQTAATDLTREARELQSLTRESQGETRRLASAVDTLNSDRDRLYSRVTVLEQGLESVTGTLARQNAANTPVAPQAAAPTSTAAPANPNAPADPPATIAALAAQAASPPPTVAPVATTAAALTERPKPEKREKSETPAPTQAQAPIATPQQQEQASAPAAPSLPKIASTAPASSVPAAAAISSLLPPKSLMAPPDPAASKLEPAKDPAKLPASAAPAASPETAAAQPSAGDNDAAPDSVSTKVERTEFAVDLGSANSVGGLRALWRGLVKSNADLAALKPIIVIKERSNGLGMQLRLAAGPLMDAATAAKICAALAESERSCETTLFDGQRLALGNEDPDKSPVTAPAQKAAPGPRGRHSVQKHSRHDDPPPPPRPEPSTLSSFFGRK
ncbi:MAG TPA: hypothetical protein VMM15_19075 [Bradyrhizobium sp.]|nr:hypothetical protein [Bradyrhizobium sp.]